MTPKKVNFSRKKYLEKFVSSKICLTFALAFGKQRGNAADERDATIDP